MCSWWVAWVGMTPLIAQYQATIVNPDTGSYSTPKHVYPFTDTTITQFESPDSLLDVRTDTVGRIEAVNWSYYGAEGAHTTLIFRTGDFLEENTKFQFSIQSDSDQSIDGRLDIKTVDKHLQLPVTFNVSSTPNKVIVPLSIEGLDSRDITEIQWVFTAPQSLINQSVLIDIHNICSFTDWGLIPTSTFLQQVSTSNALNTLQLSTIELIPQGVSTNPDTQSPAISAITLDGKDVLQNDYISSQPVVSALFEDSQSGLAEWQLMVFTEDDILVQSTATQSIEPTQNIYNLNYTLDTALEPGRYYITLVVTDHSGNTSSLESEVVEVTDAYLFDHVVFGPNPFDMTTGPGYFNYQLSQEATVDISIYSISGDEVWHTHIEKGSDQGGSVGFNAVAWEGRAQSGQRVANGPYIGYVMATVNGKKLVKKVKILVLK